MKTIKQLLITIAVLLFSATASAYDFEVDGIYYNILSASDFTVEVTSGDNKYSGDIVIPSTVAYKSKVLSITNIEAVAFSNCENLTSLTVGSNVINIENGSFEGCKSLIYLCLEDGTETLELGCNYYSNIYSNTTGNYAGEGLFRDCPLERLYLGRNISFDGSGNAGFAPFYMGQYGSCVLASMTIGKNVTRIPDLFFRYAKNLTAVHISDLSAWCKIYFSSSDANPLYYAQNLYLNGELVTELVIPDDVTEINDYAFHNCSGLTSVTIGNDVTGIGKGAFRNCSGLTSVTIGNSVTNIGDYAFEGCSALTAVHISNLSAWCNIDSKSNPLYYAKNLYLDGEPVTNIVVPNGITEIKANMFAYCSNLVSVTIPSSVLSIANHAFNGCSALKELCIEDSEETLTLGYNYWEYRNTGKGLFYDCPIETLYLGRNLSYETDYNYGYSPFYNKSTLTSVTIGYSVNNINDYTFDGCSGLTSIYLFNETPPYVHKNNFTESQYVDIVLYVPQGSLAAYQSADVWKNFWDIQEIEVPDRPETPSTPDISEPEEKKCATPVITYNNSGLDITTETDGAEIHTDITCSDANSYNGDRIDLSATYSITTYATKSGYLNSDTATATLCWIAVSGDSEDNSIIKVEAMPVLITCNNGTINICSGKEGAEVVVYTTSGVAVGNATITNGNAIISTGLAKGEIAVISIAGKGIKVVMQ